MSAFNLLPCNCRKSQLTKKKSFKRNEEKKKKGYTRGGKENGEVLAVKKILVYTVTRLAMKRKQEKGMKIEQQENHITAGIDINTSDSLLLIRLMLWYAMRTSCVTLQTTVPSKFSSGIITKKEERNQLRSITVFASLSCRFFFFFFLLLILLNIIDGHWVAPSTIQASRRRERGKKTTTATRKPKQLGQQLQILELQVYTLAIAIVFNNGKRKRHSRRQGSRVRFC